MSNVPFEYSKIDAVQFADIWNKFDADRSGYIEEEEVDAFFKELSMNLLKKENPTDEEIATIKKTFTTSFNVNEKISMSGLGNMLLPPEETFLLLFRRKIPLNSSVTFMKIWRKYDKNKSGFINVDELKNFIADYVFYAGTSVPEKKLQEYAESIMKIFDRNGDKLLDLQDMARLVNVSQNFLLQFKLEDCTREERKRDFEKIFAHYDQSKTGALEGAELDGFVKDMMEPIKGPLNASQIDQIRESLLSHVDANSDGRIQKSELALCLGVHL